VIRTIIVDSLLVLRLLRLQVVILVSLDLVQMDRLVNFAMLFEEIRDISVNLTIDATIPYL